MLSSYMPSSTTLVSWRSGLTSLLPAMVTTFAVCPVPLAVEPDAARQLPGSSHSGRGGDAVSVVAAVTAAGALELVTLRRGALTPLTATVTASIGACWWR